MAGGSCKSVFREVDLVQMNHSRPPPLFYPDRSSIPSTHISHLNIVLPVHTVIRSRPLPPTNLATCRITAPTPMTTQRRRGVGVLHLRTEPTASPSIGHRTKTKTLNVRHHHQHSFGGVRDIQSPYQPATHLGQTVITGVISP